MAITLDAILAAHTADEASRPLAEKVCGQYLAGMLTLADLRAELAAIA